MKTRTKTRAIAIGGLVLLLLATTTASAPRCRWNLTLPDFAPDLQSTTDAGRHQPVHYANLQMVQRPNLQIVQRQ